MSRLCGLAGWAVAVAGLHGGENHEKLTPRLSVDLSVSSMDWALAVNVAALSVHCRSSHDRTVAWVTVPSTTSLIRYCPENPPWPPGFPLHTGCPEYFSVIL